MFANIQVADPNSSQCLTEYHQENKKKSRNDSLLEENIFYEPLSYEDFSFINLLTETENSHECVKNLDIAMFKGKDSRDGNTHSDSHCDEIIQKSQNYKYTIDVLKPINASNEFSNNDEYDFDSDDLVKNPLYRPSTLKTASPKLLFDFEVENNSDRKNSGREDIESNIVTDIDNHSEITRNITTTSIINDVGDFQSVKSDVSSLFSKTGEVRKRKKFNKSCSERQNIKKQKIREANNVKPGCDSKCRKKCSVIFSEETRLGINNEYWALNFKERRTYLKNLCSRQEPQRRKKIETNKDKCKTCSFRYFLINSDNVKENVCKTFFLTTLGYKKRNDKFLYNTLHSNINDDRRGKHQKFISLDKNIIRDHFKLYNPIISHYSREYAKKRLYLPSDINIKMMHADFRVRHPEIKVSYDAYRVEVKKMNISFTKLRTEKCEACEEFSLHNSEHKIQRQQDCETCNAWDLHLVKAKQARDLYLIHKQNTNDPNHIYVSADLQKIIMLPRMKGLKSVLLCPRLIVLNESFVPLGKSKRLPLTVVWHETLSGWTQDDIISAFHAFFKVNRNMGEIDIWLDNCARQNKNWLLFEYLVYLINSNNTATNKITLNYLLAGHTFMSANHLHHQIELKMSKRIRISDFPDFIDTVKEANSGKISVKEMLYSDFYIVRNYISQRKIQNSIPKPYLNEIVRMSFIRGQFTAMYKTNFAGIEKELNFLTETFTKQKGNIPILNPLVKPRGISRQRKNNIINKLGPLMLPHNLSFWEELAENSEYEDENY